MRVGPEAIVSGLYAAWRLQDVCATLAYCTDDIRYTVHQPLHITGVGANIIGKAAVTSYLNAVCAVWEFLEMTPELRTIEGNVLREQVRFRAGHRLSGMILEGRKRHVWVVDETRVVSCDEYQDAEKIDAFLRLAKTVTA
jgi:ketosteroid isomerase-like protein